MVFRELTLLALSPCVSFVRFHFQLLAAAPGCPTCLLIRFLEESVFPNAFDGCQGYLLT